MDSKTAIDEMKKGFCYVQGKPLSEMAIISKDQFEAILKHIEELEENNFEVYEKINGEWVKQTKGEDDEKICAVNCRSGKNEKV